MPAIEEILHDTGLFPVAILRDLIQPFFDDAAHPERWFVCDQDRSGVVGFGYYRPEPLTDGAWNLVAIAVRSTCQGQGVGERMLTHTETELSSERLLIIETSSLDDYDRTRRFYEQAGYALFARIPDYWAEGDDKIIYGKRLG